MSEIPSHSGLFKSIIFGSPSSPSSYVNHCTIMSCLSSNLLLSLPTVLLYSFPLTTLPSFAFTSPDYHDLTVWLNQNLWLVTSAKKTLRDATQPDKLLQHDLTILSQPHEISSSPMPSPSCYSTSTIAPHMLHQQPPALFLLPLAHYPHPLHHITQVTF